MLCLLYVSAPSFAISSITKGKHYADKGASTSNVTRAHADSIVNGTKNGGMYSGLNHFLGAARKAFSLCLMMWWTHSLCRMMILQKYATCARPTKTWYTAGPANVPCAYRTGARARNAISCAACTAHANADTTQIRLAQKEHHTLVMIDNNTSRAELRMHSVDSCRG